MNQPIPSESAPNIVSQTASNPWTDLGLTLPVFVLYHLGVALLPVRNAADWGTQKLMDIADSDMVAYGGLTVGIAVVYVGVLAVAGRGRTLRWGSFVYLMVEAVVYAIAMRLLASYVVGKVSLGAFGEPAGIFASVVLSCGAGFYEEIAFRVGLFGLGYRTLLLLFPMAAWQRAITWLGWAVASAALFSLWHYVGPGADALDLKSFVFRAVCGCVFTLIYAFRGFAPAVWTHALYDIWVMSA